MTQATQNVPNCIVHPISEDIILHWNESNQAVLQPWSLNTDRRKIFLICISAVNVNRDCQNMASFEAFRGKARYSKSGNSPDLPEQLFSSLA